MTLHPTRWSAARRAGVVIALVVLATSTGCGGSSAPSAPTASANAHGTSITFAWSGGGDAGKSIANYQINVDRGGWQDVGSAPGSQVRSYGYGETHSVQVRVVDAAGQISPASNTASATTVYVPPQPPSISITRGRSYGPNSNCASSRCSYVNVQVSHFTSGAHLALAVCDNGSCSSAYKFTADANGNYTLNNFFYFGYPGHVATVVENNYRVTSNGIAW